MILGLSGKRGVGKTTLATYLWRHHGFVRVGFAEKLKELAVTLFPLTVQDMTDPKLKEKNFAQYDWSPRDFLINFGEFMRYHDKEYWLRQGLALCKDKEKNYVFDDVRFINEATAIKDLPKGYIIRINRYPKLNVYGPDAIDIPSETDLDNFQRVDAYIHDCENVSKADLFKAGDRTIKELAEIK